MQGKSSFFRTHLCLLSILIEQKLNRYKRYEKNNRFVMAQTYLNVFDFFDQCPKLLNEFYRF